MVTCCVAAREAWSTLLGVCSAIPLTSFVRDMPSSSSTCTFNYHEDVEPLSDCVAEESFNRFMSTWDGQWGVDVDFQYQHHQQQQQQQHDLHLVLRNNVSSSFDEHEEGGGSPPIIYNRNSVLSIAPQTLLPMIVSQVIETIPNSQSLSNLTLNPYCCRRYYLSLCSTRLLLPLPPPPLPHLHPQQRREHGARQKAILL
jgi:hypothetical protein